MADKDSVDHYMGQKQAFSGSHDEEAYRLHRKRFAGGAGTYPLVGTPERIASEMVKMHEVGFAGTTVSFVNFKNELPLFHRQGAAAPARSGLASGLIAKMPLYAETGATSAARGAQTVVGSSGGTAAKSVRV